MMMKKTMMKMMLMMLVMVLVTCSYYGFFLSCLHLQRPLLRDFRDCNRHSCSSRSGCCCLPFANTGTPIRKLSSRTDLFCCT